MLLWHGTRTCNLLSIMAQGMRIAPKEAQIAGALFGKGLYFADVFSKSMSYCEASFPKVMLLCEVSLGDSDCRVYSDSSLESANEPFKSVKGIGSEAPLRSGMLITPEGLGLPAGTISSENGSVGRRFNEYIIYDRSQVAIRYVLFLSP